MKKIIMILMAAAVLFSTPPAVFASASEDFTTADALTVLKASAGLLTLTQEQEARYDINGDFVVDTADALAILHIAAGLPGTPELAPLMWLVTAPCGQTMYLFGSIHAGDESLYPLPDTIMNAFEACDYLAVEFDMLAHYESFDEYSDEEWDAYWETMMYPEGDSINNYMNRALLRAVRNAIRFSGYDIGIPVIELNLFRPVIWLDILNEITIWKAGLSYGYGIDLFFLEEAYERGMGILEVESPDGQRDMMLDYSYEVYEMLFESALDINYAAEEMRYLFNLWKRGNERLITRYIKPSVEEIILEYEEFWDDEDFWEYIRAWEEYDDAMLLQRDIQMAEAAKQYMEEGKKVFFVVGLTHLLGENSVVDLLRRDGYIVERVRV
jgi:hypothetical protein